MKKTAFAVAATLALGAPAAFAVGGGFEDYARVTNVANGRSVVVRINDRGPFKSSRVIDLSYVAAYKLGYIQAGQAQVEVEAIVPGRNAGL